MTRNKHRRGAAPALAVFLILILLGTALVLNHVRSMDRRKNEQVQRLMAADVTKATNASIKAELSETLFTSITAAMYDVGTVAGKKENVENRIVRYLNERIRENWDYPNMEVYVPPVDENSIKISWNPDGSVEVRAYLNSKVKHINGVTCHGIFLSEKPDPRFLRIKNVADTAVTVIKNSRNINLDNLEKELNENYECEGLEIALERENLSVFVTVKDLYDGESVITD